MNALSPRLEDYGSFLTVAECAAVLRIGRATAYDYVRDGILPSVRMGHRVIVPKSALEQMAVAS